MESGPWPWPRRFLRTSRLFSLWRSFLFSFRSEGVSDSLPTMYVEGSSFFENQVCSNAAPCAPPVLPQNPHACRSLQFFSPKQSSERFFFSVAECFFFLPCSPPSSPFLVGYGFPFLPSGFHGSYIRFFFLNCQKRRDDLGQFVKMFLAPGPALGAFPPFGGPLRLCPTLLSVLQRVPGPFVPPFFALPLAAQGIVMFQKYTLFLFLPFRNTLCHPRNRLRPRF